MRGLPDFPVRRAAPRSLLPASRREARRLTQINARPAICVQP